MRTDYIGCFRVPYDYFGAKAVIHLCFDPQTLYCLEVHGSGYFRSCIPPAATKGEAVWLIQNHPSCKDHFEVTK